MAVDTRILLQGLREYSDALRRHALDLQQEFHSLHGVWAAFSQTYAGTGADLFRSHWQRTEQGFHEYINQSHRVLALLDERIEALARLDDPSPDL